MNIQNESPISLYDTFEFGMYWLKKDGKLISPSLLVFDLYCAASSGDPVFWTPPGCLVTEINSRAQEVGQFARDRFGLTIRWNKDSGVATV